MTATVSKRSIAGTAVVFKFNWPKYFAVGVILVGALLASAMKAPALLCGGAWFVAATGCLFAVSSLIATWWIYDHRNVYQHLTAGLTNVGVWASVHAGFDDATPVLMTMIGSAPVDVVELTGPASSSLRRARKANDSTSAPFEALPFATGSLDAIFITFAVHEVRDRTDQRALFAELSRALRPGGRLVVTEHLRDLANFVVYGPGALHFQRGAVWQKRAAEVGLTPEDDHTITPFVHRISWLA